MSSRSTTRAASEQLTSYASRQWTPAQMAAALHRMVEHTASERAAVRWANTHTPAEDTHVLTKSSLHRMFATLPRSLCHPDTSSEGQLLEHVHVYQASQRQQQNSGLTLLTAVEEALLVDWIVRQSNMNAPASPWEVKDRAWEADNRADGSAVCELTQGLVYFVFTTPS